MGGSPASSQVRLRSASGSAVGGGGGGGRRGRQLRGRRPDSSRSHATRVALARDRPIAGGRGRTVLVCRAGSAQAPREPNQASQS